MNKLKELFLTLGDAVLVLLEYVTPFLRQVGRDLAYTARFIVLGGIIVGAGLIGRKIYLYKPDMMQTYKAQLRDLPKFHPFVTLMQDKAAPIIRISDDDGFCSAFVIDDQYAATAAHCGVFVKGTIRVFDQLGTEHTEVKAKIIKLGGGNDRTLIQGDFSQFNAAPTELDNTNSLASSMGNEVIMCGYPGGQKTIHCVLGVLLAVDNFLFIVKSRGLVMQGMSGGPLISLTTGQVIGILSSVEHEIVRVEPTLGLLGVYGIEP